MKFYFKTVTSVALLMAFIFCIMPFGVVTAKQESRFSGYSTTLTTRASTSETINYTRKEYTTVETVKGVPKYNQISDLTNSCGAIAGAIIVGFYDKYFEDLVPNYQTYVSSGTYKGRDSVHIPSLMRELYTLMRTNIDDVGVSEKDCLNGLKAYVSGKGHSIAYNSVKYLNRLNETTCTNAINNNHPILLFCDKMDLYEFSLLENSDILVCSTYVGGHVCVGYGIYVVNYYNGNNLFRTDKYIHVSTGLGMSTGYLKIDSTDWCNGAYEVVVS